MKVWIVWNFQTFKVWNLLKLQTFKLKFVFKVLTFQTLKTWRNLKFKTFQSLKVWKFEYFQTLSFEQIQTLKIWRCPINSAGWDKVTLWNTDIMIMNTDGQEHLRHGGYIKEERNNLGAAMGKPKTFAFRATPPFLGGKFDCLRNFCPPCRQNFCLPCRTPQNRTKWLKTAPLRR